MKTPAFEDLQELLRFVTKARPKSTKIFSDWSHSDEMPKYAKLFHRAISDTTGNEAEVAQSLGFANQRDGAYKKLRSDLIERMENMLFFLDLRQAGYSSVSQAYLASDRHIFIVKRIINLGGRKLGTRLCHRWIGLAVEYERWTNAAQFALYLREAATLEGKKSDHRKYSKDYRHYMDIFEAEQNAEMVYESVRIEFARDPADKPELAGPLRKQLVHIEVDRDRHKTFGLSLIVIDIRSTIAQLESNYHDALKVCGEVEVLLSKFPKFSNRFLRFRWALEALNCAYELGEASEAEKAIQLCESLHMDGENNWFIYKQRVVRGSIQFRNFEQAQSVLTEAMAHPRFDQQSAAIRERFAALQLDITKADGRKNKTKSTKAK